MTNGNPNPEEAGGLNLSPSGDSLSQTAGDLLHQIARTPGAISSIQFTINLNPPAPSSMTTQTVTPGILVRQVVLVKDDQGNEEKMVRISFVPDEPLQSRDTHVTKSTPEEKSVWNKLLGDPDQQNIDIDRGVAIFRINKDGRGGVTSWFVNGSTNDLTKAMIVFESQQGIGGGPGTDLIKYIACITGGLAQGKGYAEAASHCLPQLIQ